MKNTECGMRWGETCLNVMKACSGTGLCPHGVGNLKGVLWAALAGALLWSSPTSVGAADGPPPFTPGGKYRKRDMNRPRPRVIVPPGLSSQERPGRPPSDAIVLFGGEDLNEWEHRRKGEVVPAEWTVRGGVIMVAPGKGSLVSRRKFADCQIHIEWATPAEVKGEGQGRGNSGIFLMGHPEIQILDSFENDTYPDGQAAALYGLYPPLVNASREPGEWQTYDIIYRAPKLASDGSVVQAARYTVFHNGVLVHDSVEVPGKAVECNLLIQDHGDAMRFRNIWVRELRGYDEP